MFLSDWQDIITLMMTLTKSLIKSYSSYDRMVDSHNSSCLCRLLETHPLLFFLLFLFSKSLGFLGHVHSWSVGHVHSWSVQHVLGVTGGCSHHYPYSHCSWCDGLILLDIGGIRICCHHCPVFQSIPNIPYMLHYLRYCFYCLKAVTSCMLVVVAKNS